MSVSMSDTHAAASSTSARSQDNVAPQGNAERQVPAPNGNAAANVRFLSPESQGGPVFGDRQSLPARQNPFERMEPSYSAPATSNFVTSFKHWVGHCFSGYRPPFPGCSNPPPRPNPGCSNPPPRPNPGCSNPPPRPNPGCSNPPPRPYPMPPCRPDPQYSLKNNEQLAQQLSDNFNAFRDRNNPGYISVDSIHAMAKKGWSPDPVTNANIRLANELLRRPELMSALDRNTSTGALDGLINRQNVNAVIKGENYFKYKSDKELAGEMLKHFNELKSNPRAGELSFHDLRRLASQSQTGDSSKDHLVQLAQEILRRSDVLKKMDNLAGRDNDGRISWQALYQLSR
ncbi:type III secretion effector protein [Pseudomonas sivasensis]|uniref:type III secretion effector protein n=1 Tax=Pseudomonas sivasensis TaxID=1880678 RepID=UPI0030DC248A